MPIYTFLIFRADGASTSLDVTELSDDHVAAQRASTLLASHASSSHVEVWEGEREICTTLREALAS